MKIDINIPDEKSGDWSVTSFSVEKNELSQMISMFKTGRGVPEGTYKRLMRNGYCVMSNTPDEIHDFEHFIRRASGNILINGLGLGVIVNALLMKDSVTTITVIEKSKDVINLVAKYITDDRVTIINDDAFAYKPPKGIKYDAVWHDIWDVICSDNLKEMHILHRKYGKRSKYQESWCKDECKRN